MTPVTLGDFLRIATLPATVGRVRAALRPPRRAHL
jgi:hypothetical protein